MVCPYKATCALITTIMSIWYVSSTFADAENTDRKESSSYDDEELSKEKKKPVSPMRRILTIAVLVIFHLDLFTTGYLRMGVKQLIALGTEA